MAGAASYAGIRGSANGRDWFGAYAATLAPLIEAIQDHVFAAERIHADDTTVPVLAKNKKRRGRLRTYVRDDRPSGGHGSHPKVLLKRKY